MSMTKGEARELLRGIPLLKELKGFDFAVTMAENKELLLSEQKPIDEGVKMTDKYAEYEEKRLEICKKYAKKDEKGKPVIDDNGIYDIEDHGPFNMAVADLQEGYIEEIRYREDQLKDFEAMLKMPSDVEIKTVDKSSIKNIDDITLEQGLVLSKFLA